MSCRSDRGVRILFMYSPLRVMYSEAVAMGVASVQAVASTEVGVQNVLVSLDGNHFYSRVTIQQSCSSVTKVGLSSNLFWCTCHRRRIMEV